MTSRLTSGLPLTSDDFFAVLAAASIHGREIFAVVVELLNVEVFDIRAEVGETPGDVAIVPDDDHGRPGRVTPATSKSPAVRCASYQAFGMCWSRCMSFDNSGLPETVCAPETTQLLEPG